MQEIYYNIILPILGIIGLYLLICLIIVILDLIIKLPLHRLDRYRIKKEYSDYISDYFQVFVEKQHLIFRHYYTVEKGFNKGYAHDSVKAAKEWIRVEKERNEHYYQLEKNKKKSEYIY